MHPTQTPVSVAATRPSIADPLRRAALFLIRHGWTQDNHYSNQMTPVILRTTTILPAADVLGALVLAATGRTLLPGEVATECGESAHRELHTAAGYLADWLGLTRQPDQPHAHDPDPALMVWDDAPP